jgi:RNA polymerase sigma-70 factor (ECF subfamily)
MAVLTPPRGTPVVPWAPSPGRATTGTRPLRSTTHRPRLAVASVGPRPVRRTSSMVSSSTTLPDVELVELARSGDRSAFDELLRRHDPRMRGLAYRLTADRHRMDDALQEAYLKAFRALPRFRAGSDFGTWLYRITYNACIDELRKRKRSPVATDDPIDPVSSRPGPERVVSAAETVRHALAELPVDQRVTVVLVDGEGFDHREAAEILGVAPGTVASRLHRARAALRRVLGEEVR